MIRSKVVIKRVVSVDGKSTAEAKSVMITSSDVESTTNQVVSVEVSSSNGYSSSSASSSVSSSTSCSSSSTSSSTYSS